jgi:hypothetical protein
MRRQRRPFFNRLLPLAVGAALFALLVACGEEPVPEPPAPQPPPARDLDIVSNSSITGTVNGEAVEGSISASFNTGRGGSSTCTFSMLPQGFSPATFGTHT